jgi:hypothetical protein
VFADEILEERKLVARLAASSSQPTAPAPEGHHLETSMPAAQLALAANEGLGATTSNPSAKSTRSMRAAGQGAAGHDGSLDALEDEDGTIETGSAPAARARLVQRTDEVSRRNVAAPRSRAAQLVIGLLLAFAIGAWVVTQWILPREPDDTKPVDVAVQPVDVAPPATAPVVAPVDVAPPVVAAPVDAPTEKEPVVAPVVKKPVVKKSNKPPKGALPGVVIRYLEQRCPTLPCARKLIAHKSDWVDLPIAQLRSDLDQCVARCEK